LLDFDRGLEAPSFSGKARMVASEASERQVCADLSSPGIGAPMVENNRRTKSRKESN